MKYLAAVDLSEASLFALDTLRAFAGDEGGDVTLLHVVDLDLYTAGGSIPGIMEFAEERLGTESKRLAGCGLNVSGIRVEQGDATATILRVAAHEHTDLVVMTNLGKGERTGRMFGSTAERVASNGSVPVLIERLSAEDADGSCRMYTGSPFDRVLVAVDFDSHPVHLLRFAQSLPDVGAMRTAHVARNAADVDDAWARMNALIAAAPADLILESEVLVGEPTEALLDLAGTWGATTIALSPCSHSALHRALWGSVARKVALGAECSVLFVPSVD
jgi:nucleotide-binding universal stress UspA family protein